jgi:hypothetical protein
MATKNTAGRYEKCAGVLAGYRAKTTGDKNSFQGEVAPQGARVAGGLDDEVLEPGLCGCEKSQPAGFGWQVCGSFDLKTEGPWDFERSRNFGAGDEIRTHDIHLGKVALYH